MKLGPALALALISTGCSKKSASEETGGAQVTEVGALVPPSLHDKLTFVQQTIKDGPYAYLVTVPRDWKRQLNMFGPPDDADPSMFMIVYKCESEPCKAMDWNTAVDSALTSGHHTYKVENDTRSKTSRVVLAEERTEEGTDKVVLVARWLEGADHYLWCEAHLGKAWSEATPVFVKACELTIVNDSGGFHLL